MLMPKSRPVPLDQIKHLLAPARVESGSWLVKQYEAGIMDDGLRKFYALLHASGVLADAAVAGFIKPDVAHGVCGARAGLRGRQAADLRHVGQEF